MTTAALLAAVCLVAWLSHNAQAAIGLLENHVNGVCGSLCERDLLCVTHCCVVDVCRSGGPVWMWCWYGACVTAVYVFGVSTPSSASPRELVCGTPPPPSCSGL